MIWERYIFKLLAWFYQFVSNTDSLIAKKPYIFIFNHLIYPILFDKQIFQ